MNGNPMTPFGRALLDYHNGDRSAVMTLYRDDGTSYPIPASSFFTPADGFTRIERHALDLCSGRVLDIGAGTGRHSLVLQERGLEVEAIDLSPEAAEIMKQRGVLRAGCSDIYSFESGGFDTLLLLGHGIGMTGTLEGLRRFLVKARTMIRPGGRLVFDSLDVRCTNDPANLDYHEKNRLEGRYIGEIRIRFGYKGVTGSEWNWLQVDPETTAAVATKTGWHCEILLREPTGDYLAKLRISENGDG